MASHVTGQPVAAQAEAQKLCDLASISRQLEKASPALPWIRRSELWGTHETVANLIVHIIGACPSKHSQIMYETQKHPLKRSMLMSGGCEAEYNH